MRAPEHSDAFNRTIKLYQTMAALGVPITAHGGSGGKYQADDVSVSDLSPRPAEATTGSTGTETSAATKPVQKGMNVKDVLKNPALAKLLVTAARKLKAHDEQKAEEAKRLQMEQHQQKSLDPVQDGV